MWFVTPPKLYAPLCLWNTLGRFLSHVPWSVCGATQSRPGITLACWYIPLASFFFELTRVGTRTLSLDTHINVMLKHTSARGLVELPTWMCPCGQTRGPVRARQTCSRRCKGHSRNT